MRCNPSLRRLAFFNTNSQAVLLGGKCPCIVSSRILSMRRTVQAGGTGEGSDSGIFHQVGVRTRKQNSGGRAKAEMPFHAPHGLRA